jgi:hypothetical protein
MIAPAFLDELRARIPVSEIVRRRVHLRRRGREWVGLSPFNKERSPSFFVNDRKGFFHDFSSGKHGDIFAFIIEVEGASFPEAVERCAEMAGMALPGRTSPASLPRPPTVPTTPRAADAEEAARERSMERAAAEIWRGALDVGDTLAARYLAGRNLVLPEAVSGRVLRFHPRCAYRNDADEPVTIPALIALFRDARTDEPKAILRRGLTPDGGKFGAKPLYLGPMAGCAIKLTASEDVCQGLHVAEGVETAIAVRRHRSRVRRVVGQADFWIGLRPPRRRASVRCRG